MDELERARGRGGGMDMASATGIVNAMKTGNIVIDMAIAMCRSRRNIRTTEI